MTIETFERRAPLAASSWNAEERTFEVVFSTGAPVERIDARGAFLERLSLDQDWTPFVGAPVLNSHRRGDLADVLGHVIKAWTVSATEGRAVIKLSRRPEVEAVVQDVLDGHLRGVSVGYAVSEWSETTTAGKRTKTATRWAPGELSIVPIAADPGATIRGEPMPQENQPPSNGPAPQTRAVINGEIRALGASLSLPQNWIDAQVDAEATVEAARSAALDALLQRSPGHAPIATARARIGQDHTDPDQMRAAMADAVAHRLAPGRVKLEGRASQYRGLAVIDMVAELAAARGGRLAIRDRAALAERALTASDFPALLADASNKALLAAYEAAAPTYRRWAAQRPFSDFKPHTFLRVGDFPAFQSTAETGELRYGSLSENKETVKPNQLDTGIIISRQALANDDLSALGDFSTMIAARAAADENSKAYAVLAAAILADGKALFHADHGNLASSGSSIASGLDAAVAALRAMKGLDGLPLNIAPRFLIVGPAREAAARRAVAEITPAKSEDVNPWSTAFEVIVDAGVPGNAWHLAADPAAVPSIVYGYVGGASGPEIRTTVDFDTRSVKVAAGLDFGVGAIDFRGLYRNPGA